MSATSAGQMLYRLVFYSLMAYSAKNTPDRSQHEVPAAKKARALLGIKRGRPIKLALSPGSTPGMLRISAGAARNPAERGY